MASEVVNIFKYTDYGAPIIYQKPDYRTANARAHRFILSAETNFVPRKAHLLCSELKRSQTDYRPQSESAKEFTWKINSKRFHREDLAMSAPTVRYLHQFTDKVKANGAVVPLQYCKTQSTDVPAFTALPREPKISRAEASKLEYKYKETHLTSTDGYFPYADPLVSTTTLDFHPHPNYSTARTNLIVRKEFPFNSDVAFFIPKSKLINENPTRKKYCNETVRDISKFVPRSFDRIVPNRCNFVKNFGLTTEMNSNY